MTNDKLNDERSNPNQVTDRDVADVFCTALEGGINYWAHGIDVASYPKGAEYGSEVPAFGGTVELLYDDPSEPEGNGNGGATITREALANGIRRAAEFRGLTVERFVEEHDADEADVAVQFMLFGDVIYG